MAVLPSLNTIGGFIINVIYKSWNYAIPCKVCKQGEALVKCKFGKVIEQKTIPGLYWKIPFVEEFDTVNVKIQTSYLNAHSFLMKSRQEAIIPTNVVIDAQIEYKILEPTCVYSITEESLATCIDNKVHEIINNAITDIEEKIADTSINKISDRIEDIRKDNSKLYYFSLNPQNNMQFDDKQKRAIIEILNIVVTSFDYNFSLRTTQ